MSSSTKPQVLFCLQFSCSHSSSENTTIQMNSLPKIKTCQIIQWQMVFPEILLPHVTPASERQLPSTPAPCSPRRGCTRSHCCPADGSLSQSSSCSGHCSAWSVAASARKAWLLAWKVTPSLCSSQSYQHPCRLALKASSSATTLLQK